MLRVQKLIEKNARLQDKNSVGDSYDFGKNTIHFKAQEAIAKGRRIELSKKEAMLLKLLIENKNEVVTRKKFFRRYGDTTYTQPPGPSIILF